MVVNHGHLGAEFGKHAGKLQADVTSTDDYQFLRQTVQFHCARGCQQGRTLPQTGDGRDGWLGTGVDEDSLTGEFLGTSCGIDGNCMVTGKLGGPVQDGDGVLIGEHVVVLVPQLGNHFPLALDGGRKVGTAGGLGDQPFRGEAGNVDAGAPVHFP